MTQIVNKTRLLRNANDVLSFINGMNEVALLKIIYCSASSLASHLTWTNRGKLAKQDDSVQQEYFTIFNLNYMIEPSAK